MRSIVAGFSLVLLLAGSALAAPAAPVDYPPAPAGDAALGATYFQHACSMCHTLTDKSALAPSLKGVVGRPVGSFPDYKYSDVIKAHGGTWTTAKLYAFLKAPQTMIPNTNMPVSIANDTDRANIVAFLATVK